MDEKEKNKNTDTKKIDNKKATCIIIITILILLIIGIAILALVGPSDPDFRATKLAKNKKFKLPRVYITGHISGLTKAKGERDVTIKYESDDVNFEKYAKIKVQGNSSTHYRKKNYTIKLFETEEYEKKFKVDVGFGKQSKYCLKANFIDKTHSRNIIAARIAAKLQEKRGLFMDCPNNGLIDGFPVLVFINDEFWGIYTFNIPKDEWMWNLDTDNPKTVVVEGENNDALEDRFMQKIQSDKLTGFKVEVGEENKELIDNLNRLIEFVMNSSDEEFKEHFEEYFNKDSAINYLLMIYLTNAIDNTAKNMMLVSYDQKLWYTTLYDMDITFGTDWNGSLLNNFDGAPNANRSLLWERFEKCFKDELNSYYSEYRKDIFTKEYIMGIFKDFTSQIPQELKDADASMWGEFPGQDIDQIADYLDYKLNVLDKHFEYNQ